MAWELIQSITLESEGDNLVTDDFTGTNYPTLQKTVFVPTGVASHAYIYFNDDDGANYARSGSANYGTNFENSPDNEINLTHDTNTGKYAALWFTNPETKLKSGIGQYVDNNGNGVGNSANTIEWFYKWCDTSECINKVKLFNQKTGTDFPVGTYLNVFGDKQT